MVEVERRKCPAIVQSPGAAGGSGSCACSVARPSNPSRVRVTDTPWGRRSASSRRRSASFTLLLPLAAEQNILRDFSHLKGDDGLCLGHQPAELGDLPRLEPADDAGDAALQEVAVRGPPEFLLELLQTGVRGSDPLPDERLGARD